MSALADLRWLLLAPWLAALALALVPARLGRPIAVAGAGLATLVWLACLGGVAPVVYDWLGRGVSLRFELGPLAGLGAGMATLAGLAAIVEEEAPTRARLLGLLALQGVVTAAVTATDAMVLAGAWALVPVLVLGLLAAPAGDMAAGTGEPEAGGRVAGRALALSLALGTGALTLAAAGLAVAQRAAAGGTWSAALIDLAAVRTPLTLALPLAGMLALAGALALGLWPLHAGLVEGTASGSRGTARLLAGPVRWLGLDALIRVWAPLTPLGAAALAPGLAGLAVVGAVIAGLTARVEIDADRRAARVALVGWSVAAVGVATLAHEGLFGAVLLGLVAGLGQPTLARGGAAARAVLGLAAALGGALVVLAALRFADLTLGVAGPWYACGAALALGLAGSALARATGPIGHVREDRSDRPWSLAHVLIDILTVGLAAALLVRPGVMLARIVGPGEGWVQAIAMQRCLALHEPKPVPTRMPAAPPSACESPLGGLRAGLTAARAAEEAGR